MIHSDKFFVSINSEPVGGLWCIVCLAANRRPAIIHEWHPDATQPLADLVSRAEAHWAQKHQEET
jgi:hypothetical protein